MTELMLKLNSLIVKNNFNLTHPDVIKLSQKLDKEIVKEQIVRIKERWVI